MLTLVTALAATHAAPVWGLRVGMDVEKTKGDDDATKQALFVNDATKLFAIGADHVQEILKLYKGDVEAAQQALFVNDATTQYDAMGVPHALGFLEFYQVLYSTC